MVSCWWWSKRLVCLVKIVMLIVACNVLKEEVLTKKKAL
jgi:hypothetical protein